jgi:hypothetical protein
MNSMISRREGQSEFLDKVTDDVASAAEKSTGTKKTASATNHPAEKAATESSAVAKTNHPAEKTSSDTATKKEAGETKGPGIPDGTGPLGETEQCQLKETEKDKTAEMTMHQARVARRQGKFVKVAGRNDLYQEANTDNYWKISEDKNKVVRAFNESNGLVTK